MANNNDKMDYTSLADFYKESSEPSCVNCEELAAVLKYSLEALEGVLREVPTSNTAIVKWAKQRIRDGKTALAKARP